MKSIPIRYCFTFSDRSQEIVNLELHARTLELINDPPGYLPSWTTLGFHQCPNCPLTPDTAPHCPLAVHLVSTVSKFQGKLSFHEIHLNVITCLLYTSDAADDLLCVDLGGSRLIKKKTPS